MTVSHLRPPEPGHTGVSPARWHPGVAVICRSALIKSSVLEPLLSISIGGSSVSRSLRRPTRLDAEIQLGVMLYTQEVLVYLVDFFFKHV